MRWAERMLLPRDDDSAAVGMVVVANGKDDDRGRVELRRIMEIVS